MGEKNKSFPGFLYASHPLLSRVGHAPRLIGGLKSIA